MDETILYDKIYACWLGKNIGGTLGAPVEGRTDFMDIRWFPSLGENGVIPNDDLDLQLLNLHALEQFGPALRSGQLAREWVEHNYFPVDEYGYALTAVRRGLMTPLSGKYNNMYIDCMGSPIRSEIWAAVCAGRPKLAAFYAWQDAVVDHAGGEGLYGEIFNAVIESLAYLSTDIVYLIREALTYIPKTCRVYRAVNDTLNWYLEGISYKDIRGKILSAHGSHPLFFTDAPQNIAFSLIGLLYGNDFEDGMLKTANYGYDTDCTVATYAALFGIMYGSAAIPKKWSDPIGDLILLSKEVRGFRSPHDLRELTERTIRMYHILSYESEADYTITSEDIADYDVQHFTVPEGELREESIWVTLKYGPMSRTLTSESAEHGGPGLYDGERKQCFFTIRNHTTADWTLRLHVDCPDGFRSDASALITLHPCEQFLFRAEIVCDAFHTSQAEFTLVAERINEDGVWMAYHVPFILIRSSKWLLNGREMLVDGTFVEFTDAEKDGRYVAESTLYSGARRMTQLYIGTKYPMKFWLDGRLLLDSPAMPILRSSYSTGVPESQCTEVMLEEGEHTIHIELCAETEIPKFACIITAKRFTGVMERPLIAYEFIDNVIG